MGWHKFKRGLSVPRLRTVTSGIQSTGPITASTSVSVGGVLTASVGLAESVQNSTSTGALNTYGVSRLALAASGNFTLGAPTGGRAKWIVADSTKTQTVTCGGGSYFMSSDGSTSASVTATFNAKDEVLYLMPASTIKWYVVANPQGVTFTT